MNTCLRMSLVSKIMKAKGISLILADPANKTGLLCSTVWLTTVRQLHVAQTRTYSKIAQKRELLKINRQIYRFEYFANVILN